MSTPPCPVSLVGFDGCITLAFVMSVVRLRRCSINSTNIIHGIPLNVMAVTELMVAQAASTPVHCCELCFTCKIYKGYLHGNLNSNMDYECVIP